MTTFRHYADGRDDSSTVPLGPRGRGRRERTDGCALAVWVRRLLISERHGQSGRRRPSHDSAAITGGFDLVQGWRMAER